MRWRVGLLVLVVALSACERGRGERESPPTTRVPSAMAMAMALMDLPKGFTVDGSADDTAPLDACREVSQVAGEVSAFVRGDLQRVVAAARSFDDEETAAGALDDLSADPGQSCLGQLVGAKEAPSFEAADTFDLGDDAFALRVSVPASRGLTVVADIVSIRIGRVVATAAFIGGGAPLPAPVVTETMKAWRTRIERPSSMTPAAGDQTRQGDP